jgi:hypothetical protein
VVQREDAHANCHLGHQGTLHIEADMTQYKQYQICSECEDYKCLTLNGERQYFQRKRIQAWYHAQDNCGSDKMNQQQISIKHVNGQLKHEV